MSRESEAVTFSKKIMKMVDKKLKKHKPMKKVIVCIEPNILKITKMRSKYTGFFTPYMEGYIFEYESMKAINFFVRLLKTVIRENKNEGEK